MNRLHEALGRRVDAPAADAEALQDQRAARHDRHPVDRGQGGGAQAPADARRRRAADRGRQGDDRGPPARPAGRVAALRRLGGRGRRRPPDELLAACQVFVDRNYMRRFAAVLNHRKAGFGANGMAVWQVPEEDLEEIGPKHGRLPGRVALLQAPDLPRLAVQHLHDGPRALEGGLRGGHRRDRRGHRRSPTPPAGRSSTRPTSSRRSGSCTSRRTTASGRTWRSPARPSRAGASLTRRATRSAELFARAQQGAGGRGQLARAGDARHRPRPAVHRPRRGPLRVGRRRQPLRRLPLHLGPGDPRPRARGRGARGARRRCRWAPPTARPPSARCSSPRPCATRCPRSSSCA